MKDACDEPAIFESLNSVSHRSVWQIRLFFNIAQSHCSVCFERFKDQLNAWWIISELVREVLIGRDFFCYYFVHDVHQSINGVNYIKTLWRIGEILKKLKNQHH